MKEKTTMKRCDKCGARMIQTADTWRRMETANGKSFAGQLKHNGENVKCGGHFISLVTDLTCRVTSEAKGEK